MSYNYVPDDMLLYYLFWKKSPVMEKPAGD